MNRLNNAMARLAEVNAKVQANQADPSPLESISRVWLITDNEATAYIERQFWFEYDYQPWEPAEANGYPGCQASVTINAIKFRGIEVTRAFTKQAIAEYEREILDAISRREAAAEDRE